jgi:hypothetical protein
MLNATAAAYVSFGSWPCGRLERWRCSSALSPRWKVASNQNQRSLGKSPFEDQRHSARLSPGPKTPETMQLENID